MDLMKVLIFCRVENIYSYDVYMKKLSGLSTLLGEKSIISKHQGQANYKLDLRVSTEYKLSQDISFFYMVI